MQGDTLFIYGNIGKGIFPYFWFLFFLGYKSETYLAEEVFPCFLFLIFPIFAAEWCGFCGVWVVLRRLRYVRTAAVIQQVWRSWYARVAAVVTPLLRHYTRNGSRERLSCQAVLPCMQRRFCVHGIFPVHARYIARHHTPDACRFHTES